MSMPRTFLILDDDADNRFLIRHRLLKAFPEALIIECHDPVQALAEASEQRPSAVISDHHLGLGDGIGFIEQLRADGHRCPVLMVTASSDPAVHLRARAAGAAGVFAAADRDFIDFLGLALDEASESEPR